MGSDTTEVADRAQSDHLDALLEAVQLALECGVEDAVTRANEAIAAAKQANSIAHQGKALHLRGWARFGTGEMREAITDQLAAMELLTACASERDVGRSLHALGAVYDTIGEPALATEHFVQAMEIQARVGDKWGEARTMNGLAVVMARENRQEEAAAAFLEVARRFAEVGDDWWVLMARVNRAAALLEHVAASDLPADEMTSMRETILADCDDVITGAAAMGSRGVSVEVYVRECRAAVLRQLGDPQASLDEVERTLPLATRAGDMTVIVGLEMEAARSLDALGRPEAALDRLDRAAELAKNAGRDHNLTQCLELRSDICEVRGDLAGALEAHREFHTQKTRARRDAEEMRAMVIRALLETQRAEHELDLARSEVEKLEAMHQERRRMVSIIAHELRNPITSVLGLSSEMSRNWDRLGDEGAELIAMIRDEAKDLANIVEDLLVAERIEDGSLQVDPEFCDLEPLVAGMLDTVPLGGKSVDKHGTGWAYADPIRVRQILRNLVCNAVRYGGDQITIAITIRGTEAHLEVRDNGNGVPEKDREAIFEPYGRSDSTPHEEGSVGLGLAATRQLARLMGGDVRYDEVAGETVFRLTLPAPRSPSLS